MTPVIRALVLRAPGINCDRETAQACRLAGFTTDLLHINQLLKTPKRLLDYAFLVIPGGFSYGDDLGAGTLLAKNLTIHLGPQLRQFVDEGRLVLGICNGFQVLVRAGLLPGPIPGPLTPAPPLTPTRGVTTFLPDGTPIASLTDNTSAQFECRWITLSIEPSNCIFTQGIEHPIELPVAHGEGQFVLTDASLLAQLQANGQVPMVYSTPAAPLAPIPRVPVKGTPTMDVSSSSQYITRTDYFVHSRGTPRGYPGDGAGGYTGEEDMDVSYPHNPNGSIGNIAGVCNKRGNVFGLMPHPERYVSAMQHPQRQGNSDGTGDGLCIFKNAYAYAALWAKQSYATSGVDIAAADRAKALMKDAVHATHGPAVLAGMGAFAGVLDISSIQQMQQPALVASTDGVGTKTLLAITCPPDRLQAALATIGYDLVNHSVNDLLMQGAKPLFFMDYLAMGKLDPVQAATIVRGVAEACQHVGCALLGGETAEMPDVYLPGAFDLAGTIVGVVERAALVNGATISAGDVILGLPSSGLHTNGYSLARRVFAPYALDTVFPELGEPLADALLRPHRCYLSEVQALQAAHIAIKGMAHITGGGFEGNIVRILPTGTQAVIETQAWTVPPLFQLLAHLGQVSHQELYRTLNMGIGMVLVLAPKVAEQAQVLLPELIPVGHIITGKGVILH